MTIDFSFYRFDLLLSSAAQASTSKPTAGFLKPDIFDLHQRTMQSESLWMAVWNLHFKRVSQVILWFYKY